MVQCKLKFTPTHTYSWKLWTDVCKHWDPVFKSLKSNYNQNMEFILTYTKMIYTMWMQIDPVSKYNNYCKEV